MAMLVTRKEAADHLRIDDVVAEKDDLDLKIQAASAAVLDYIEMEADDFLDSDGYDVPFQIKAAILLLVGDMYHYRGSGAPNYDEATLPGPIRALLYPVKTWGIESD